MSSNVIFKESTIKNIALFIFIIFFVSCEDNIKKEQNDPDLIIYDYEYEINSHFFIHEWFRNGVYSDTIAGYGNNELFYIPPFYPLVDGGLHSLGDVKVEDFHLYEFSLDSIPDADTGIAYIDPNNPALFPEYTLDGKFIERNEISDYSLDKFLGYIWMTEPDAGGSVYACRFKLVSRHTNNTLYSVGESQEENGSILKLKLINTSSPQNNPCSQLMWKNVYSLGKRFNQGDKITVRIKNYYENEPSVVGPDEIPYITLFGLDLLDEQGALIPDGKFDDMNSNLWNPENGLLIFPMLYPFVSSELYSGGNPNNDLINELGSGIIYSSTTSQSNVIEDSRFLIEIYYEN